MRREISTEVRSEPGSNPQHVLGVVEELQKGWGADLCLYSESAYKMNGAYSTRYTYAMKYAYTVKYAYKTRVSITI